MTNAFILGTCCPHCLTAQIDNADLSHGDTTKPINGPQPSVEITGLGICYAEQGVFVNRTSPYNEYGCAIANCPTGAKSNLTIPPGRYFAMNLAIEYPNRIKAQPHGVEPLFPANGYEYYRMYAVMLRYNPFPRYCNPGLGLGDYAVYQGVENAQRSLPLGGQSPSGGWGGAQAWNVFVCVQ